MNQSIRESENRRIQSKYEKIEEFNIFIKFNILKVNQSIRVKRSIYSFNLSIYSE